MKKLGVILFGLALAIAAISLNAYAKDKRLLEQPIRGKILAKKIAKL